VGVGPEVTNGVKSRGLAILKVQPGQNWVKKFKRIMLGMFPSGLEKVKALVFRDWSSC